MCPSRLIIVALLFFVCSGCGTLQRTTVVSQTGVPTLDNLNQALSGQEATLTLIGGNERLVRNVHLGAEETQYEMAPGGMMQSVPTEEVARIVVFEKGSRTGNYVGPLTAVPGIIILGIGGVTAFRAEGGSGRLVGYVLIAGGIAIAAAGWLLGSVIGDALVPENRTQEILIYEGPVERYLQDDMPP